MDPIFTGFKKEIDTEILALCNRSKGSQVPWAADIADRLANFALRGKSIRGSIFLLSVSLFDGNNKQSSIQIAAVLEILHSALLIHDDIIDHDELRRGIPTIHSQYKQLGDEKRIPQSAAFGEAMAICMGDIAIFGGFSYLASLNLEPKLYKEIISTIADEFLTVGFGEIDDVAMGYSPTLPTKDQVLSMYLRKTARYTFSLPLKLGAIFSSQPQDVQTILYEIGENLGKMFQLQDDVLTLSGDTRIVGKTIGNDISENKKTYSTVLLFERADEEEKKTLQSLYGNRQLSDDQISYVVRLLQKYSVLKEIQSMIEQYANEATKQTKLLNISAEKQQQFQSAIDGITHRTK